MSDRGDRRIQDYLDDRMSADERDAFEALLAQDDDLALRVRDDRALGAALREEVPELSPAFYTRLRGRFEERTRRSWRWIPPLSWEALGLVAAAVLVAVVFVPDLLERGTPETASPALEEALTSPPIPRDSAPSEERENASEPGKRAVLRDDPAEIIPRAEQESEGAAGNDRAAAADLSRSREDADSAEPRRQLRAAKESERGAAVPAPAPASASAAAADKRAEEKTGASIGRLESVDALEESDEFADVGAKDPEAGRESRVAGLSPGTGGRALPTGLVAPGEVREVTEPSEWSRIDESLGGGIGRYERGRRLILVGAGDRPRDCALAEVTVSPDAWEVRFYAPAPQTALDDGCFFVLPDDGRPVRLAEGNAAP